MVVGVVGKVTVTKICLRGRGTGAVLLRGVERRMALLRAMSPGYHWAPGQKPLKLGAVLSLLQGRGRSRPALTTLQLQGEGALCLAVC